MGKVCSFVITSNAAPRERAGLNMTRASSACAGLCRTCDGMAVKVENSLRHGLDGEVRRDDALQLPRPVHRLQRLIHRFAHRDGEATDITGFNQPRPRALDDFRNATNACCSGLSIAKRAGPLVNIGLPTSPMKLKCAA